jgi:hypothetical protein
MISVQPPKLEFLFTLTAEVGEITSLGHGPLGERRVIQITGGHFEGPQLRGDVMPGADWQIVRADGAIDLDARYAIREDRGGIVRVISQGMRHGPPDVLAQLARGEEVAADRYFFRTIMRFETGAAELAFLNKTIAVATAARRARQVELQAWRLL